jgi:hypothetical protein
MSPRRTMLAAGSSQPELALKAGPIPAGLDFDKK